MPIRSSRVLILRRPKEHSSLALYGLWQVTRWLLSLLTCPKSGIWPFDGELLARRCSRQIPMIASRLRKLMQIILGVMG